MTLIALCGMIAAICTTISFIPQIVKIQKQGGKDLSYGMLCVYLTGVILWLVYGLAIQADAVIWANAATAVLVAVAISLKAKSAGRAQSSSGRLRIAVDMDEVIADALPYHLARYNEETGEHLTAEEITEKGLRAAIPEDLFPVFWRIPHEDDFFANLGVIKDSRYALRRLSTRFDVFVVTAAMDIPSSFAAKYEWLRRHFPFIPPDRIVFCGNKEIVNADYLIDDRSRHFTNFCGTGILFTAPHNARENAPLRVDNWQQVLRLLLNESRSPNLSEEGAQTQSSAQVATQE